MADKTLTIKGATDKELDELIFRLRKESEVQSLLSDIKRKSGRGYMPYEYGQEISTEKAIDSLYHVGVLGMHWGHRKARGKNKTASEDHVNSRKLKSKGVKNLSTKELKDLTQRLQLEKQLKDLNPKKYKKGLEIVKGVTAAGTTLATLYALSKTPLAQDIKKAVTTAMENGAAADKLKWVL